MSTREIGAEGEAEAVRYLKKQGYKILERNVATNHGEIDVIARHQKDIVFLEVKLRNTAEFGRPEDAVDRRKQLKIIKSAMEYIKAKRLSGNNFRFDVLAIGPGETELFVNAFPVPAEYTL